MGTAIPLKRPILSMWANEPENNRLTAGKKAALIAELMEEK
jgi:hypothetical protein